VRERRRRGGEPEREREREYGERFRGNGERERERERPRGDGEREGVCLARMDALDLHASLHFAPLPSQTAAYPPPTAASCLTSATGTLDGSAMMGRELVKKYGTRQKSQQAAVGRVDRGPAGGRIEKDAVSNQAVRALCRGRGGVLTVFFSRKDEYMFFEVPVNVEEVTDYLTVVSKPMDFGTMQTKIINGEYATLEEFEVLVSFSLCERKGPKEKKNPVGRRPHLRQRQKVQQPGDALLQAGRQGAKGCEKDHRQGPPAPL